ncbi:MAG TPA: hypothetical protein VLM40_01615 [Gemmata sp.]|nr:hypothetical protein [Gemmata sp.]
MITLYVDGQRIGAWSEAEQLFAETAGKHVVEFRDTAGHVIAISNPGEPRPEWESRITPEETARRMAEPGYTFDELKKRLGWE